MDVSQLADAELIDIYCNAPDHEDLSELAQAALEEIERRGLDV
ncbi:MAG TPA: hypothetical protein VIR65_14660 [Rhizorhapis sp.]